MRDRPFYVTLLCWYLIIFNAWRLVHSFAIIAAPATQVAMHLIPVPIPVQMAQYFLSMIVPLVTAMFMTEGMNWGRVVYIGWGIANYLFLVIFIPGKPDLQPGLSIFAVAAILLLLPWSRGYFLLEQHHS